MGLFDSVMGLAGPIGYAFGGPVGGIVGSSLSSAYLGDKSADKQSALSQGQYDQTRSDLGPYREAGVNALNQYTNQLGGYNTTLPQYNAASYNPTTNLPQYNNTSQLPSYTDNTNLPQYNTTGDFNFDLQSDPGYQFALDEAMKQANRGQASIGGFNSGNRLAELTDRATGVASQYANDAFGRQLASSQENYGRNLTDFGIAQGQEQDLYGRGLTSFGINRDLESDQYSRDLTSFGIAQGQEQDLYNRNLTDYGIRQDQALTGYNIASGQESDLYGRNQNYLNQLSNLAGAGQNAAVQTGGFGAQNTSNQINAEQFGTNSLNNAIQGGMSNYLTYDHLNQPQQWQSTGYTGR